MKENNTKKFNITNFIRPVAILLVLVVLVTVASVSWIRREWAPYISSEDGITIATSGALVFYMDSSGETASSSKTINELLGVTDFELRPVSSPSGRSNDFFKLDYTGDATTYNFTKLPESTREVGIANGYIDITFWIKGEANALEKFVYLHEDSHIGISDENGNVSNAAKALRIAVTVGNSSTPILLSAEGSNRANNKPGEGQTEADVQTTYKAVYTPGKVYSSYDYNTNTGVRDNSIVRDDIVFQSVSDYNGYDDVNGNKVQNHAKCLFSISNTEMKSVNIRIWLEGEDLYCTESISDSKIDLMIKFAAYDRVVETEDESEADGE